MENLFLAQLAKLKSFLQKHSDCGDVELDYYEAWGKYPCLRVIVGPYLFDMEYRPQNPPSREEIHTTLFFQYTDKIGLTRTKGFMLRHGVFPEGLNAFAKVRSNYHFLPVSPSTWADEMIRTVEYILETRESFIKLCKISCPFNADGSHKFSSWKNYAQVKITRLEDNPLIQGVKDGATPSGTHVVGGNGSFREFNKGDYCIEYVVERLAGECPRRGQPSYVNMDTYLRELMARLGRQRMPYDMLNARLPERLEVITYDMDLDPDARSFVPVGYDESWQNLLEECFKEL